MRILIAHDDRRELVALRRLLERAGHEVVACDCAARVIAVSEANHAFDVAVLEMNIGAHEGVARELCARRPVPVVLMAGRPSEFLSALA